MEAIRISQASSSWFEWMMMWFLSGGDCLLGSIYTAEMFYSHLLPTGGQAACWEVSELRTCKWGATLSQYNEISFSKLMTMLIFSWIYQLRLQQTRQAWTAMVFSLELMKWARNSARTLFCLRSPRLAPKTLSICQIKLLWLNMAFPALDLHNCSVLVWIRKPDDLWRRAGVGGEEAVQ